MPLSDNAQNNILSNEEMARLEATLAILKAQLDFCHKQMKLLNLGLAEITTWTLTLADQIPKPASQDSQAKDDGNGGYH